MEKHNPIFSLKNFRSFNEEGADFELAPITVLTGCNSAGKSSLVKALMLISGKTNSVWGIVNYKEDIKVSSRNLGLGGFKAIAHNDGMVEMDYTVWSPLCREQLIVTRTYCAKYKDLQNDGELYHLTVKKTDGTLVYELGPGRSDSMLIPNVHLNPTVDGYNPLLEEYKRYYAVWRYRRCMDEYLECMEWDQEVYNAIKKYDVNEGNPKYAEYMREIKTPIANKRLAEAKQLLETVGYSVQEVDKIWKETGGSVNFRRYDIDDVENSDPIDSDLYTRLVKKNQERNEAGKMEMFLENVVNEAINPTFIQQIEYISSSSAQVMRLYTFEDNNIVVKF